MESPSNIPTEEYCNLNAVPGTTMQSFLVAPRIRSKSADTFPYALFCMHKSFHFLDDSLLYNLQDLHVVHGFSRSSTRIYPSHRSHLPSSTGNPAFTIYRMWMVYSKGWMTTFRIFISTWRIRFLTHCWWSCGKYSCNVWTSVLWMANHPNMPK